MSDNPYTPISPAAQEFIRKGGPPSVKLQPGEIPPVAISWGRMGIFKTGAWRNVTPRYVKRLPPCRAGCPVGNDIEGWLEAYGKGDVNEALRLLTEEQPLPAVCGRVCYHPCEDGCNRRHYDGSVNIRAVERFLGDKSLTQKPTRKPKKSSGARVLVIGSGPAGLSAAWMLARLGHTVEIHERAPEPGGLLRYGIPAYRLPRDVLKAEINRLSSLCIDISCGIADSRVKNLSTLKADFDAVFLSPGAADHRSSGIKGSTTGIVINALDFLTDVASETPVKIGRNVIVIGGGNSAVDAARVALRLGSDVTILYRRTRSEMPAYAEEVDAAVAEGVKIQFLVTPDFMRTGKGRKRLRCIRNVLGKVDDSGRRRPEAVPGTEFEIPADCIIDAVGEGTDPSQITEVAEEIEAFESVDIWGRTGIEGVFAGGDFTSWNRTIAHAIGAGKRSALLIDTYIKGDSDEKLTGYLLGESGAVSVRAYLEGEGGCGYVDPSLLEYQKLNFAYHPSRRRAEGKELDAVQRVVSFDETVKGLSPASVNREAERCFHCGTCDDCGNCHVFCPDGAVIRDRKNQSLSFDLEHCKGCGICAEECPRGAIELVK